MDKVIGACKVEDDFDRIANRHRDAVYAQMVRLCGNHDDAEDALVTALTAAYRALPSLRDEEAFRGWLAKIARRTCYRLKGHAAWVEIPETVPADEHVDEEAAKVMMRKCIKDAVEGLPEILRQVYFERDILQRPAEEVAQRLNLTVPAVKSRLHRARKAMREALENSLCADESFTSPPASE